MGKTEVYWSVAAPGGRVSVYESGEAIEFAEAGTYRLTLMVSDDWNYTVDHYTIEAVQEG